MVAWARASGGGNLFVAAARVSPFAKFGRTYSPARSNDRGVGRALRSRDVTGRRRSGVKTLKFDPPEFPMQLRFRPLHRGLACVETIAAGLRPRGVHGQTASASPATALKRPPASQRADHHSSSPVCRRAQLRAPRRGCPHRKNLCCPPAVAKTRQDGAERQRRAETIPHQVASDVPTPLRESIGIGIRPFAMWLITTDDLYPICFAIWRRLKSRSSLARAMPSASIRAAKVSA